MTEAELTTTDTEIASDWLISTLSTSSDIDDLNIEIRNALADAVPIADWEIEEYIQASLESLDEDLAGGVIDEQTYQTEKGEISDRAKVKLELEDALLSSSVEEKIAATELAIAILGNPTNAFNNFIQSQSDDVQRSFELLSNKNVESVNDYYQYFEQVVSSCLRKNCAIEIGIYDEEEASSWNRSIEALHRKIQETKQQSQK